MVLTIAFLAGALAVTSICFYIANLIALFHWQRQKLPAPGFAPPLSILKPLKGCDEGMYEAFRSHCLQDYAEYEIIFGINDKNDLAISFVERLRHEFPNRAISLIVCTEVYGENRKASNLVHLVRAAKHRYVVINDSDITVSRDYLQRLARWFSDFKVGMVTCLYRPGRARGVWSKLEALGIVADFMPGALTARMLEGKIRFGLGSTMAIDRQALEKSGGMEAIADYLADDYQLAKRIADAGHTVLVPEIVVESSLPHYSLRDFWHHQLRWGRTVRTSRPVGYFGLVVTFGIFWAILLLATVPDIILGRMGSSTWSISPMLSLLKVALVVFWNVIAARLAVLLMTSLVLGDRYTARHFWLLPVRDLITPVVWALSLLGNEIMWRGERFELRKGKLKRK